MRLPIRALTKICAAALIVCPGTAAGATEPMHCQAGVILPGDNDRGCCVYKTTPTVCATANRGFCRTTADEANQDYKFYKGAACKNIVQCKKQPNG